MTKEERNLDKDLREKTKEMNGKIEILIYALRGQSQKRIINYKNKKLT